MLSQLSIDELREIVLALPTATCLLDRDTRYLAASQKYASVLETPLATLKGKSMTDFCPPELVANAFRDFQTFDKGESVGDHEITFKENSYLVSVNPVYRNGSIRPVAITVALANISKLKKLETALAQANQHLFEAYGQIKLLAETDSLTGLLNRYGLEAVLTREIGRARRECQPIAMAIVDIDWFKLYNDGYGHIAGDAALKAVGRAIQSAIRRPGDSAARYGGEEFIVILPNTDLAGAMHVAGNIRRAVNNLAAAHSGSSFGHLTVSLGVSAVEAVSHDAAIQTIYELLLRRADKALYAAKAAGRNEVKMCDEP